MNQDRVLHLWLPVTFFQVMTGVLVAMLLAATVPFFFLSYISAQSGLALTVSAFFTGALCAPLASLLYRRNHPTDNSVFRELPGYDVMIWALSGLSALAALAALANQLLLFVSCGDKRGELDLLAYVFNLSLAASNQTLTLGSSLAYRQPFFATNILWFQACLDESPVVIALLAIYAGVAAVSLVVFFYAFTWRDASLKRAITDSRRSRDS